MRRTWLAAVILTMTGSTVHAEAGMPVAVRFWGQGLVTIETYWNLRIAIDPYGNGPSGPQPWVLRGRPFEATSARACSSIRAIGCRSASRGQPSGVRNAERYRVEGGPRRHRSRRELGSAVIVRSAGGR